jgi:hypothetical protein
MDNLFFKITLALSITFSSLIQAAEIDFEGLTAGLIVDRVQNGSGATGLPSGYVGIFGFKPSAGLLTNTAIIYDSDCPPGGVASDCTGEDIDLGSPNENFGGPGVGVGGAAGAFANMTALKKIIVVAQNLSDKNNDSFVDDPNDAYESSQFIEFDFRTLKGASSKGITVNDISYIDNDEGEFNARVLFFGPGTLNPSDIGIPAVGDNGVNTLKPGIEGVTHMQVVLDGSGGVSAVTITEEVTSRPCWVTTGGFNKGEVGNTDPSGKKYCTFGGNIGPAPSGAFEVNWHDTGIAALDGSRFHTNDIRIERCENRASTGPQQPGGKKGLEEDTLVFSCDGLFNNESGYTCTGFLLDGGEPAGKKGNDFDEIQIVVNNEAGGEVARCEGELAGGNVQIHPPVGK